MNPELLLAHFDRICNAPHAIPRIRRLVLDLAVRGKLVEQAPSDERASGSVRRVRAARKRLSTDGIAKDRGISPGILPDEEPYALPDNWQWIRLGDCLEMINGRAFKPSDWAPTGLPIVRIQNLNSENAPFNYCNESIVAQRNIIESGCFLISWSGTPGTSFGAFIWKRGRAALNQHIFRCVQIGGAYYDRFLQIAINGRLDEMISRAHGGVGLQHITKGKLENLPLSLPPLAEQYRIVAKVDELVALCDLLDAAERERDSRLERLTSASYHHLDDGVDSDITRKHAHFFVGHLQPLTSQPFQMKQLRQAILNFAVRGRLVSQNSSDEPAPILLERLAEEIEEYASQQRISPPRPEPVTESEMPHAIPPGWVWTRLCSLFKVITDGDHQPPPKEQDGVAFLTKETSQQVFWIFRTAGSYRRLI